MKLLKKFFLKGLLVGVVILLSISMGRGKQKVYANGYLVDGNVINVTITDSSNAYDAIESALQYAHKNYKKDRIFTVNVPAGEYNLNGTLHIYKNTTLDVQEVKFHYVKDSGNMIMLGKPSYNKDVARMAGYGTVKNISILGGTWNGNNSNRSSLVRMAHGSNITFEGCVFSQGGCSHQMEVAAINGFTVKDCTFEDMHDTGRGGKKEALQLDMPTSQYVFSGIILDGTPMKNVDIEGCTFENVPRGLGTHNILLGQYHTNIKIANNTFRNVNGECIVAMNYADCEITGNDMENCGAGILFTSFRPPLDDKMEELKAVYTTIYDGKQVFEGEIQPDARTVISNNTISLDPELYSDEAVGIRVFGYNLEEDFQATGHGSADYIPEHNYYISNVKVTGNDIVTSGYGIHMSDTRNSTISQNYITANEASTGDTGIMVDAESKNITIQSNTVEDVDGDGIKVTEGSLAKNIVKNHISGSDYCGINIYGESHVLGNIEKNVIEDADDNGINVEKYSAVKSIVGNTVTSSHWHGINVLNESSVTDKISGNKITGSKENGIFLNEYSEAKSITSNTLKENGKYGIALYDGSEVGSNIVSNKISKNHRHAIQLKLNCSAKNIEKNTITDITGKGICIEEGASIKGTISSNKIRSVSQEGIYIHSNLNAFSIKKNTISSCSRIPIVIDTSSSKRITVTQNSLKVKKGKQRLVVLKGNVKSDIKK